MYFLIFTKNRIYRITHSTLTTQSTVTIVHFLPAHLIELWKFISFLYSCLAHTIQSQKWSDDKLRMRVNLACIEPVFKPDQPRTGHNTIENLTNTIVLSVDSRHWTDEEQNEEQTDWLIFTVYLLTASLTLIKCVKCKTGQTTSTI